MYKRPDGGDKESGDCSQRCTVTGPTGSRYKVTCKNLSEHMKTIQCEGGCMLEQVKKDYGISICEDIQNLSIHSSEQPELNLL